MTESTTISPGSSKAWQLLTLAAVVAATVGYLAGSRRADPSSPAPAVAPSAHARRAPSYGELRERNYGPNALMYENQLARLSPESDLFAPLEQTDEQRQAALLARAERRAYDGAPPVIPHAIDQRGYPDCLSCHGRGARLGDKLAPRMSHERYDSCTQCHVVAATPLPNGKNETPSNSFEGLLPATAGERAWEGAPPTIPHATRMRGECSSCHGPYGRLGMRSTHPWRQSCTQCHAPSAALDGSPGADAPSTLGALP